MREEEEEENQPHFVFFSFTALSSFVLLGRGDRGGWGEEKRWGGVLKKYVPNIFSRSNEIKKLEINNEEGCKGKGKETVGEDSFSFCYAPFCE